MSEEREIADRLLRVAASASTEPTLEEQTFTSLIRATRSNFRRNEGQSSPRGGRKRKRTFKRKVVLVKLAHADFFPSNQELKFLKQRGLGEPDKQLEIGRFDSSEEIMEQIVQLFNPNIQNLLQMCGFKLARADKTKKIIPIGDIEDGSDLEAKILQGKILILPHKDFPCDLPVLEEQDPSAGHSSLRSSSQPSIDAGHSSLRSSSQPSINAAHSTRRNTHPEDSELNQTPITSSRSIQNLLRSRMSRLQMQRIEESEEEEEDENHFGQSTAIVESNIMDHHVSLPELPEGAETTTIEISRNDCLNDLMNVYNDEQILNTRLNVQFLGEIGIDGGGLTKELFNIFFEKCEVIYFQGEDCLVPYLPLNKRNEQGKFITIGRILRHMLVLTGTIPAKLSRITFMLIANPDTDIESSILLQELLQYVNPYLRKVLKKGLKDFMSLTEGEKDIIQDFYQTNQFYAKPNPESLSEQINIIATEVLVETPRRLIEKIRQGVSPEEYSNFWKNCDFGILLDMQSPTPTKVANCLVTDPNLTNEENEVLHYLIMYINCLDKEKVSKLVFLITGSFLMPNYIKVKFNDSVGLSQRPIFSTCTDTLTLPKTYANYSELKNDLNICLNSDEAKEYTSY